MYCKDAKDTLITNVDDIQPTIRRAVVNLLREAVAVVGKANYDEFGIG